MAGKKRTQKRNANAHLRRLTQAYLTPISQFQPSVVRTAHDKVDSVYYLGWCTMDIVSFFFVTNEKEIANA